MAAQCAVCLSPITKADKFAISGTEVMHTRCVGGQTIGTITKLRLIERNAQIAALRDEMRHTLALSADVAATERAAKEAIAKTLLAARDEHRAVQHQVDVYRNQRDAARRDRDEAYALRDAARSEPAAAPAAPPAPVATPAPANDDRDPAEIRFSLLEIDKP